jgi:hypothetical protein
MGGAFNKTFKCTFSGNRNLTTAATEKRKKRMNKKRMKKINNLKRLVGVINFVYLMMF